MQTLGYTVCHAHTVSSNTCEQSRYLAFIVIQDIYTLENYPFSLPLSFLLFRDRYS